MKKALILALIAGLMLGSTVTADAKKKKKKKKNVIRSAAAAYDAPMIGHPDVGGVCSGSTGCATFAITAKERFAAFKVTDDAGLPVYILGGQDLDGDNFTDTSFAFCGQTDEAVAIEPGYEILLFISAGPGGVATGEPCAGVGTSGTVDGKFAKKTFKVKF